MEIIRHFLTEADSGAERKELVRLYEEESLSQIWARRQLLNTVDAKIKLTHIPRYS